MDDMEKFVNSDEGLWFDELMYDNGFTTDFMDLQDQLVTAAVQGQGVKEADVAPLLNELYEVYGIGAMRRVLAAFAAGWYMANHDIKGAKKATKKELAALRTDLEEYPEELRKRQPDPCAENEGGPAGLKLV